MALFSILSHSLTAYIFLISFVSVIVYSVYTHFRKSSLPGPRGYPLIGSITDFIAAEKHNAIHLMLGQWAKEYGEVMQVKLGPVTEVYLNSDESVKTIFDRASAATSERPRWIVSSELLCNSWNPLLLNASDRRWKLHRKIIHSEMTSPPRADAGLPFLNYESARFLYEVAHDPAAGTDRQDLWAQIGRYTYSNFAMQAMGFDISTATDPDIDYIHISGKVQILGTLPAAHLVDVLPVLQNLPSFLKPWEKWAKSLHHKDIQYVRRRMLNLKTQRQMGSDESLLSRVLNDEKRLGIASDDEAAFLSLSLIIGAADTSKMSTWSFLEAMMAYPQIQANAQAKIDRIVGDRIPRWEDFDEIPYMRCFMKEVWRWRPPVALGHPHLTTRDLEYKGLIIPKGSRLHINAWAIGHDPSRHVDPERFWPERWSDDLSTSQQSINSSDPKQRDHFAFGAGRRVCPGVHVAERSLGVAMMRILWAFNVCTAPSAKLPLDPKDYPGFMPGNPGPIMPVCLLVRSQERKEQIDGAWKDEESRWGRGGEKS